MPTAADPQPRAAASRLHVVLVPGFAGFDALGQLEYYAGVTPLFREWQADGAPWAVLHYFDNLPTAAVATRAARLRRWLAKRWARGEIQAGDSVALVGHSTGGLDIRQALLDLDAEARGRRERLRVDGDHRVAVEASAEEILGAIRRVVFLSVPQRGTNIADWVRAHGPLRKVLVQQLRGFVNAAGLATALNDLEEQVAQAFAGASRSDLFLAARDAVAEIDAGAAEGDPEATADAHEAASELRLFLTHVASDFAAIDDLCAEPAVEAQPRERDERRSPAHAGEQEREEERAMWDGWRLRTRSYATVARRPYDFAAGEEVPAWELLKPSTSPWSRLQEGIRARTDAMYLCGYRACAGGPFRGGGARAVATAFGGAGRRTVERFDNDGIVNTASMLWPDGDATQFLDADHGDVIGHFRLGDAPEDGLRKHHTYDLLRSASGFTEHDFRGLWREVFSFCAGGEGGA
jgi:hypothetical protein